MRVVVTRPAAEANELVRRLEEAGHEVGVCPLIEIEPLGDEPVETAGYDWLVVTSGNGARELLRRQRGTLPRVAAIGPGTAAVLAAGGIEADLVPGVSSQEGLLAEFPRPAGRVLQAGAEGARRLLVDALRADFVPLYRTRLLQPSSFPRADLVLLASASAARAYGALALGTPAVVIGPQTAEAAREAGVRVAGAASTYDLDGLVAAVADAGVTLGGA